MFQTHAVQNHPRSKVFFSLIPSVQIDKIEEHIFYCCPECSYKTEKKETFQSHAVEKHPESLVLFVKDSDDDTKSSKFCLFVHILPSSFKLLSLKKRQKNVCSSRNRTMGNHAANCRLISVSNGKSVIGRLCGGTRPMQ